MTGQELLALGTRHERGDLGRDEPRELASLTVDRLEEPGVLDGDRDLLGERRDECDLRLGEWHDLAPTESEHADDADITGGSGTPSMVRMPRSSSAEGHTYSGSSSTSLDLGRPTGQQHPADDRVPARPMGMLAFEGDLLRDAIPGGDDPIRAVVAHEVHVSRVRPTQAPGRFRRGFEDGLQVERRPAHHPQYLDGLEPEVDRLIGFSKRLGDRRLASELVSAGARSRIPRRRPGRQRSRRGRSRRRRTAEHRPGPGSRRPRSGPRV